MESLYEGKGKKRTCKEGECSEMKILKPDIQRNVKDPSRVLEEKRMSETTPTILTSVEKTYEELGMINQDNLEEGKHFEKSCGKDFKGLVAKNSVEASMVWDEWPDGKEFEGLGSKNWLESSMASSWSFEQDDMIFDWSLHPYLGEKHMVFGDDQEVPWEYDLWK